jgi:hypothetical protein
LGMAYRNSRSTGGWLRTDSIYFAVRCSGEAFVFAVLATCANADVAIATESRSDVSFMEWEF